jgi:hypothetical protein
MEFAASRPDLQEILQEILFFFFLIIFFWWKRDTMDSNYGPVHGRQVLYHLSHTLRSFALHFVFYVLYFVIKGIHTTHEAIEYYLKLDMGTEEIAQR